jgi:diacylglycerol kinase (ATP)
MTIKVLLNPYSNRWNAQKRWIEAENALKAAGVDFNLDISERAGDLENLAAKAVSDGFDTVIVAGGDGSIGEVVNGLARQWNPPNRFPAALGLLPMGSANDFAFALGLPLDLQEAARVIAAGKTKRVDLCKCNERLFVNNSGAALEPYVTTKHEQIQWIKGITRYLVAAVWAIMDKPEWQGSVEWDSGEYTGPLSLISVGNGRRTGGFFMTPHADPYDGQLTLAYGYRSTRRGLFAALPRAFKEGEGSYVELPGMCEVNCSRVKIHFDKPSPAHTDGVLFASWLTDLDYRIFPATIPVLMQSNE